MAVQLLLWTAGAAGGAAPWLAGLSWLLTYGVHALLWTGGVALVLRVASLSPAQQNWLCRCGLFAPLITAALAVVFECASAPGFVVPVHHTVVFAAAPLAVAGGAAPWALGMAAATGVGVLRFAGTALRLWLCVRGRSTVHDARLFACLERVRRRTHLGRVRLSESHAITSPLVMGTAAICLPVGSLAALGDEEVDTVFAHELAHLERRDGVWFPAVAFLQAVLWWQPFNHWLARRFRETAELACDDRAVALTADPAGLARAIVGVATGASLRRPSARVPTIAPTMAGSRRTLLPRVQRLMQASATGPATMTPAQGDRRPRWLPVGLLIVGAASVAVTVDVAAHAWPATADAEAEAASRAIAALMDQAGHIEAQIRDARHVPGAVDEATAAGQRLLSLSQELRHTRARAAWTEKRFADAWQSWARSPNGVALVNQRGDTRGDTQ